jgi:hypothetical protein
MGICGGLLILLGIGAMVLGFGAGAMFSMAGLVGGFGLLILGCVLVGLDRIYQAIRISSAAEIKALQAGFESLAKQSGPAGAVPSIAVPITSPRMAPMQAVPTGKCSGCGKYRVQDGTPCLRCGNTAPIELP